MSRYAVPVLVLSLLGACGRSMSPGAPEAVPVSFGPMSASEGSGGGEVGGLSRGAAPQDALVLVRTAQITVSVEQYEVLRDELSGWLAANDGHVADENVVRSDGRASRADLRLRVPARDFDAARPRTGCSPSRRTAPPISPTCSRPRPSSLACAARSSR